MTVVQAFPTLPPIPSSQACTAPSIARNLQLRYSLPEQSMRNTATNYTFNISSVVGSWYLASTAVGAPLPTDFYAVRVSTAVGSQSVPIGGSGGIQSTAGFAAVSNRSSYRLIRVGDTLYRLDVDPLPQLNPDEDEVLTVSLLSAAFPQCPPDGSAVLGSVFINAVPDPLAAALQAVAVASTSAAVATSALGAGAALDAQSIAVIAMMSCARPLDRNLMGNVRLLSPFATSATYEGIIAGNYILLAAVGLLQGVAVAVRRFVIKDSWQMARMFARFPGFLFTAALLCYQGATISAVKLASTRPSPESTALGVLTLMSFFLLPFGTVFVVYRYVTAEFRQYDFKSFRDGKFAGPVRFIFPYGQWSPPKMTGAYGGLFADIRREGLVWVTQPFWGPTLMVIGAAFNPSDKDGCEIQFATLAALHYLHFVFRLVTWPNRSVQSNVLSALAALCIALILTGNTISVKNPTNEGAQTLVMVGVQAQTVLTILRIVVAMLSSQLENRFLADAPFVVALRRIGAIKKQASRKGLGESAAAEEEGRFAEHHFFGDGSMWGRELTEIDTTLPPEPILETDPIPLPMGVAGFGNGGDLLEPTPGSDLLFGRPMSSFQMDDPFGVPLPPSQAGDDVIVAEEAILTLPVALAQSNERALLGSSSLSTKTGAASSNSNQPSLGSSQRKVRPSGSLDPKNRSILLQIGDEEDDLDFDDLIAELHSPPPAAGLQNQTASLLPALPPAAHGEQALLSHSSEIIDPNPLGLSTSTSTKKAQPHGQFDPTAISTFSLSISGDDPFDIPIPTTGPTTRTRDPDPFDLAPPVPAPVLPLSDLHFGLEPELAALL
jgi:hypothetical protein